MSADDSQSPSKDLRPSHFPPAELPISHPWISRYCSSIILKHTTGSDVISTVDKEVYGNSKHPIGFRIGNGGAGYTGILEALCETFINTHGNDFRIGWVANHSRHSQAALLADVVQVALTYEPKAEELAMDEGWCKRVCAPAFWDHFIIVGPSSNPAQVEPGCDFVEALKRISDCEGLFHTRGDGSATFEKEKDLWSIAGIDIASKTWLQTHPVPPYPALEKAANDGAYLLTDRATFLTAKRDGIIAELVVYVEGGEKLLNPCSALVNIKVPDSDRQRLAVEFGDWLQADQAQAMLRAYGRSWERAMPLFTDASQKEFGPESLAGRHL